jgi:spore coat protein U-like protein
MRNSMKALVSAAAIGVFAILGATAPASATTSTTNMTVGITITAACSISVTNINFGSMAGTALLSAQTSTAAMGGLFTYTCSPGSNPPSLAYGHGANYSSGNRMLGATNGGFIPYTLNMPTIATFTGAAQTAQITATIAAQATVPTVDVYSDTVVLTLSY